MRNKKTILVRYHATTSGVNVLVTHGSECTSLYKRIRTWMDARMRDKRPVAGVTFVPYGVHFDHELWRQKDVEAVMVRLHIQPT